MDQSRDVCRQEEAYEYACACEAERNGYTYEQSQECDNGSLDCKNCPFK
jgi:hypothetical protein